MRGKFILPVLSLLILAPANADERARVLAASCATCHAAGGSGEIPRLHGQPAAQILDKLAAFRSGRTDATLMHQIVPAYDSDELRLIAEYFARQP